MTINFHTLLHLTECVRRHGPMWCYTAFPYEGYNNYITQVISGSNFCQNVIVNKMMRPGILRHRINNSNNDEVKEHVLNMIVRKFL